MLITHKVIPTEDEINKTFNTIKDILIQPFATQALQDEAITTTKEQFAHMLEELLNKAFLIGKHIGEAGADEKDLSMY